MTQLDTIITQITALSGVSVAVERLTQMAKTIYLQVRNAVTKQKCTDIPVIEKEILAVGVGFVTCAVLGYAINIPSTNEPVWMGYALAGLISGLGSNVIHALVTILLAVKNNIEPNQTPDEGNK